MSKIYHFLFSVAVVLMTFASCKDTLPELDDDKTNNEAGENIETPVSFELLSPAAGSEFDLETITDSLYFEWTPRAGVISYKLLFSISADMSSPRQIVVNGTSTKVAKEDIIAVLKRFGLDYEESATVYIAVSNYNDSEMMTEPVGVSMKREKKFVVDHSARIADSINVKVAILIEDFQIPQANNKRIHQVCGLNIPDGFNVNGGMWNDPYRQMKEFERDLEASSHGVVQYEVVEVREADRFFTYFKDQVGRDGRPKEYLTLDTLLYLFETRKVDNLTSYDYIGMMEYYGYDEMVDAGELHEIWVYTFPAAGMYESQMIGNGAFWCNSPGLSVVDGAPCNELCIVMCCNYERTTDLALHAYCHRVESIMNQLYRGWNYDKKETVEELSNWEKFSAHTNKYSKYKKNYSHIGKCHWPPNSEYDYDYGNSRFVYSYADTWYDYPDIKEDDSVARRINKFEWNHPGGEQWGYMMWYYDHIPHYKGLCPRDKRLNNWWHYIVRYKDALELQREMERELAQQSAQ